MDQAYNGPLDYAGLLERSRQRKEQEAQDRERQYWELPSEARGLYGPTGFHGGPIPDPQWEAFGQALLEAGTDKVKFGPSFSQDVAPPIRGLQQAMPSAMPEPHDQFKKRYGR